MSSKKYVCVFVAIFGFFVVLLSAITIFIDPYFHYHAPNENFYYTIGNARYINVGIINNFEYDSIIMGSSMTENFKTSEFDELFDAESVKTPIAGATFYEVSNQLQVAIDNNEDLKIVVRALDLDCAILDKDHLSYDESQYPTYLYNDNIFDDVNYILNKEVLGRCAVILKSFGNGGVSSFDDYANWNDEATFGKEAVMETYEKTSNSDIEQSNVLSDEEIEILTENIEQNIVSQIEQNPDIEFYYFIPPYSITWFDQLASSGDINKYIEVQEILIEALLPYGNCKLFTYFDDFELITSLDRYRDYFHYDEDVNSYILESMANSESLLTYDNYESYLESITEYYNSFDYDKYLAMD